MINETKKVLSEPNVKVVFHHPAAPVTPLSTWIIYPRFPHAAGRGYLQWILSFVVDAEPAAQWAGAAATWTPSFLLLPALSRAEPEFFIIKKGRQSPKEGCGTNRPS
jgi:hypothetical protein